jgi:pyruvate/2-oxoglutarate dehydrogenase complex dihydrolipoamide acyltransferase (E2) component
VSAPDRPAPSVEPLARQRRHTFYFQQALRPAAPVFLDTEVEMRAVQRVRDEARAIGSPVSVVSCVLHAAARVLADHPQANTAIRGERRPKVAWYQQVNAKVAFDKTLGGRRIVLTAVLPGTNRLSLAQIQGWVDQARCADPSTAPLFAGARVLQRMPWPLGPMALRMGTRSFAKRSETVGTFAISSLGHRPVDGFHSLGGTTVTLGLGRIADRPVARDGRVVVAPVMRLNLAFDHRVIDGAEAADVLGDLKDRLEAFPAEPVAAPVTVLADAESAAAAPSGAGQ